MKAHDQDRLTTADLAATPARTEDEKYMRPADRATEARVRNDDGDDRHPLFTERETDDLRSQWNEIQANFVDEPRKSVEAADGLVASAIRRLAESFASERSNLEDQWARGGDASTEDLRLALRRYRSFFDRLLSV